MEHYQRMERQDPQASIEETVRLNLCPEEISSNNSIMHESDNIIESLNESDVTAGKLIWK